MQKQTQERYGALQRAIHNIDRMDADITPAAAIQQAARSLRTQTRTVASNVNAWTVPANRVWTVIGLSVLNNNRAAEGSLYFERAPDIYYGPGSAASAAARYANALNGIYSPVVVRQGDIIGINDDNYQAGDTDIFRILYYEEEV